MTMTPPKNHQLPWNLKETAVLLHVYNKLKEESHKKDHPLILALAEKFSRTAYAVERRLTDLRSADPRKTNEIKQFRQADTANDTLAWEVYGVGKGLDRAKKLFDALGISPDLFDVELLQSSSLKPEEIDNSPGGQTDFFSLYTSKIKEYSRSEFLKDLQSNSDLGYSGEVIFNEWLIHQKKIGLLEDFCWVSARNATAPYDFITKGPNGATEFVDVKTSRDSSCASFFVSRGELEQMVGEIPYRIYQVVICQNAPIMILRGEPMNIFGLALIKAIESLPEGVSATNFEIESAKISFERIG